MLHHRASDHVFDWEEECIQFLGLVPRSKQLCSHPTFTSRSATRSNRPERLRRFWASRASAEDSMQIILFYWGSGLNAKRLGHQIHRCATLADTIGPSSTSPFHFPPRIQSRPVGDFPPNPGPLSTRTSLIFYPKLGSEALCVHGS